MPGIADVVGIDPERILRANLAHVVHREHTALTQLMLNPGAHVQDARRSEIRCQRPAKVGEAVGEGVNIIPAGHGRLRVQILLLQMLDRIRDQYGTVRSLYRATERLATERADTDSVGRDRVHDRAIRKEHG